MASPDNMICALQCMIPKYNCSTAGALRGYVNRFGPVLSSLNLARSTIDDATFLEEASKCPNLMFVNLFEAKNITEDAMSKLEAACPNILLVEAIDAEKITGKTSVPFCVFTRGDYSSPAKRSGLVKAIEYNSIANFAWRLLYLAVGDDTISVQGTTYANIQCLVMSVEHDPTYTDGWYNIGFYCGQKKTQVVVNGRSYDKRNCLVEGLRHTHDDQRCWYSLGNLLEEGEVVNVNGKDYSNLGCFSKVLLYNPEDASAWNNAAACITPYETAIINGKHYRQNELLAMSKKYN